MSIMEVKRSDIAGGHRFQQKNSSGKLSRFSTSEYFGAKRFLSFSLRFQQEICALLESE